MLAFVDACISSLADLLEEVVFFEEGVEGSAEQFGRIGGVTGGGVVCSGQIFQ